MLSLRQREQRQAWVLLAPMLLVMLLLTAWPLLRTIWLSFYRRRADWQRR
ncbi:ABC-type sugar transport system permease subunit [Pantoea dispersa]|nr:ABC-type sugar transport system permease subunit [Pantoea dispersa]